MLGRIAACFWCRSFIIERTDALSDEISPIHTDALTFPPSADASDHGAIHVCGDINLLIGDRGLSDGTRTNGGVVGNDDDVGQGNIGVAGVGEIDGVCGLGEGSGLGRIDAAIISPMGNDDDCDDDNGDGGDV